MSEECTCHIAPPCSFCVSLTEEEVEIMAKSGVSGVLAFRRDKEAESSSEETEK